MKTFPPILVGALLALATIPWPLQGESFELFAAREQRAPAVAYNVHRDEFMVVGNKGEKLSTRRVWRRASGAVALSEPVRIGFSHGDPALSFAPDANRYLLLGGGAHVLFSTGVEDTGKRVAMKDLGPWQPAPGNRLVYLTALQRWVGIGQGRGRFAGSTLASDGSSEQLPAELFASVEFGDLGDFDLAADAAGRGVWLVWGRRGELYRQHLDLEGLTAGPRHVLADGASNRNVTVERAGDADSYLAVWEESRKIYGRVVEGEQSGPVIEISDRPREAFLPVLGFNRIGDRFLVVWTEQEVDEDLRGRWVRSDGTPGRRSFAIARGPAHQLSFDHNSVACSERSRECLVAWNEGPPGEPAATIRGRFLEVP